MTKSALVDYEQITTNSNPRGNNRIERITIHCIVGQMSAKACANLKNFRSGGCASANYIIGLNGEVLLNVPEERRAWTSGGEKKVKGKTGRDNDYKAITFECASDATSPYAFRNVVYEKLVAMCVDICKRYGRTKLLWFGTPEEVESYKVKDDEMVLTWHRYYAYKSCPGDWMYSRGQEFAKRVTAQLGGATQPITTTPTNTAADSIKTTFRVRVKIPNLNIRKSPNGKITGKYTGKGIFTIVEVQGNWGKLKSGAGWIYLANKSYCEKC